MKKKLFFSLVFVMISLVFTAQHKAEKNTSDSIASNEIFSLTEEMAEFPGGVNAMLKFVSNNLQYPPMAREAGISGRCFLKFIVNESGEISNITVLKGVPKCSECDTEAIRVIKTMPLWTPAKMSGRAVKCYYNLPISFKNQ